MTDMKLMSVAASRSAALMGRGRTQRGLSLIEFMVAITIGLILLTGLVSLFARQSSTQQELEKSSRQIENGRYAMQILQEDLQLAGYFGEFSRIEELTVPNTLPNPCLVAADDLKAAMPFSVQGYDAPAALPTDLQGGACSLAVANHLAGTDILVVRRVDTACLGAAPCTSEPLKVGEMYFQSGLTASHQNFDYRLTAAVDSDIASTANTALFNLEQKDPADNTPPPTYIAAPLRRYVVHIYFVSPCSVPTNGSTCSNANTDDGGVSIPTLKRLELTVNTTTNAPTFKLVPLVEGIENMQIDYGFDVAADDLAADGAPDSYAVGTDKNSNGTNEATEVATWADVMAVRVNLLARNNERSAGHTDTKTYNLGLAGSVTPGGNIKRRVFSQLIRLTNPSARRES